MEQVAVTGLGAVIRSATGIEGGWSSTTQTAGMFSSVPSLSVPWLDLISQESQHLFPTYIASQRSSVVWGVSKNHYSSFDNWVAEGSDSFFSDFDALSLAHRFGASGQVLCPVSACASGSHAIVLGAQLIEQGEADVVLCGADEPPQHPMILAAYRNMGAVSSQGTMRPFDKRRDGFVPASGSGFLILESREHAQKRGAQVHALVTGYSMRSDATHMTSMNPSGDSVVRAIDESLSSVGADSVGYINAHGTATRQNDELEARALERVFGRAVPISSTKALTGHLLGASGAVEAVLSILAMKNGRLPPTLGLDEPEYALDFVRGPERSVQVRTVLSLNYGFGGHIGALAFSAP